MADSLPVSVEERAQRPGNLVRLANKGTTWRWYAQVWLAGSLLSLAYPPANLSPVAAVALVPLLWFGATIGRSTWWTGYVWGLGFATTNSLFLREVFVLIPLGLGLVLALFPAVWCVAMVSLLRCLSRRAKDANVPRYQPDSHCQGQLGPARQALFVVLGACLWVTCEWLRSWLATGFPWNQLGQSLWHHPFLIQSARFTGVYGLSFGLAAVNVALFLQIRPPEPGLTQRQASRGVLAGALVFMAAVLLVPTALVKNPPASGHRRIALVQGNLPQIRVYTGGELEQALDVYTGLTRQIVEQERPEMVVWPETAVPAALLYDEACRKSLAALYETVEMPPFLTGAIDYRFPPDGVAGPVETTNSALLLDSNGVLVDRYDKIKIVPFGEFTPFEAYLPWLARWIGMGRSLLRGSTYTIFELNDARFGVNICYEDIFPQVSARFARDGAQFLIGITNDAWYGTTSGPEQHLAHAVFRAVETGLPFLRSGNNSDSLLILPDGTLHDRIEMDGNRFVRGTKVYQVPVLDRPSTPFVRYGMWFPYVCSAVGLLTVLACFSRWAEGRKELADLVQR